MNIKYIRLAHEAGLGTGKPSEIDIAGQPDILKENWNFHADRIFHNKIANFTWFGPTRFLQKILTRPPILYIGNFYSYFYHDVIHWTFRENKIYKKWLNNTEWGRLFLEYKTAGTPD